MSTQPTPLKTNLSEEQVIEYLREHPNLLVQHSHILADINVPHETDGAVSLIEHQVKILRKQNQDMQDGLQELIDIARRNEDLSQRMHKLIISLIDADDIKTIVALLYTDLKKNFHIDCVSLKVFANQVATEFVIDEFIGASHKDIMLFKNVTDTLINEKLQSEQQVFLFGDDNIASSVIIPLCGDPWQGVLAIGSFDGDRFSSDMKVDLLNNLGEMLSFIIQPWVLKS